MPRKQSTAARRARAHTRATDGAKYTETLRGLTTTDTTQILDSDAAGRRLAAALRRAGLVEVADDLEYNLDFKEPGDQPYDVEQQLISGVILALAAVAERPGVQFLAAAAEDVLVNCYMEFTADAVRSMELPLDTLPRCRAATAAKAARRTIRALNAASNITHGGDHEWHACITLLNRALYYAHEAATGNDRARARVFEPVPLLAVRAEFRERYPDDQTGLGHVPENATATRCTGCGEIRISLPDDHTDPWHHHEDEYCRLNEPREFGHRRG